MILREPRFGPIKRSELGFFPRVVTESKLFGAGLVAGAVGLYGGLLTQLSGGALQGYVDLAASSKLVSVSSVDFLILSLFAFEPIKEDMSRRGWWGCYGDNDVGRLAASLSRARARGIRACCRGKDCSTTAKLRKRARGRGTQTAPCAYRRARQRNP